jgi:hypothetical protein
MMEATEIKLDPPWYRTTLSVVGTSAAVALMGFAIYRMATGDTVGPSIENWKLLAGGFGVAVITQAALNAIDRRRDEQEYALFEEVDRNMRRRSQPRSPVTTEDEAPAERPVAADEEGDSFCSSSDSGEFYSANSSSGGSGVEYDNSREGLQTEAAALLARAQNLSFELVGDVVAQGDQRDRRSERSAEQRRREQKKHHEEMLEVARGMNDEGRRTVWKKDVIQRPPQNGRGQLPEGS